MKIEAGKMYVTRSGYKARVYAVDGADAHLYQPIHGAVYYSMEDYGGGVIGWVDETWKANGMYRNYPCGFDLVKEYQE